MVQTALIGVGINTLGGISTAVGWWLQKHGHNKAIEQNSTVYKNWHWWIGFIWVIISQPLYIASTTLANQSTLGVVGPTSIIVHVMFARFYLHEVLRWSEILGILLFVPGTIITLIFASKSNDLLDKKEFEEKFWAPMAQTYLWINVFFCFVFYILAYFIIKATTPIRNNSNGENEQDQNGQSILGDNETQSLVIKRNTFGSRFSRRKKNLDTSRSSQQMNEDSDDELISDCWTQTKPNAEEMKEHGNSSTAYRSSIFSHPRLRFIPLIAYPYIGAFMGSISTFMVRVITGFISHGSNKGYDPNLYWIVPFMVVFAVLSYIIVNKGLKSFDSVYVAPMFKIGAMISNLTTGGFLLDEFSHYNDPTRFKLFLGGCGIWVIGVILLVLGNDLNNQEEQKKKEEN